MMEDPLNAWMLLDPGPSHSPQGEIVTRLVDGTIHRCTYSELGTRAHRLMHALDHLGLERGARVASLAWNSYRHLEAYFAVPCTARVLHTLNIRLPPDDLASIMADAGDQALLVDPDLLDVVEEVAHILGGLGPVVVLGDEVPSTSLPDAIALEDLIADEPEHYPRFEIPESTPMGLCHTSGTTGRPKGVLYTHRSSFLHALAVTSAAGMSIGPGDAVLPQVPMFHANAWGMPYAASMVGAKQVLYAGALEAGPFCDLLEAERVTVAAGVPTVWLAVAEELAARGRRLRGLRHIVCGGSQPPRALIERYADEFGLRIVQAWGMTETSPLASMAWPQERMRDWPPERVIDVALSQAGIPLPGIAISIRDEWDKGVPPDGESMGDLFVRGPWVTNSYLHGESPEQFDDGWFRTGDVAAASPDGYFVITDRSKDLIKSGGEWISSVEMEAAIMAMTEVAEAAVIAVPHPKWLERPLPFVVPRAGVVVEAEAVRAHLESVGFARWQLPDRVEVVDEIPKTAVGKFDKKALRARFG